MILEQRHHLSKLEQLYKELETHTLQVPAIVLASCRDVIVFCPGFLEWWSGVRCIKGVVYSIRISGGGESRANS